VAEIVVKQEKKSLTLMSIAGSPEPEWENTGQNMGTLLS